MNLQDIREELKALPHITKVWVKGSEYWIHPVAGGVLMDLTETQTQTETTLQEAPAKKFKNKKNGN